MGTVAAAETEETAGTERRAVAEMEEVRWELWLRRKQKRRLWRKLRKRLGIWLETRNLLLPGTAGSERPSGMPGA